MTGTTKPSATRGKKLLITAVVLIAIAMVSWGVTNLIPAESQLPVLLVGYGCLYIGIILALYALWQKYLSPAAEKADKDAAAAKAAAEAPSVVDTSDTDRDA